MSGKITRRGFLEKSLVCSASATLAASFEEKVLLARAADPPAVGISRPDRRPFPSGSIGKVKITRLICGGNLISGFAHSRDLIYVSDLLRRYFTDIKVHETLQLCEEHGLNTAILRLDENTLRILGSYWKERGGKIQWIAQIKLKENDLTGESRRAIDNGAVGVYIHGGIADEWVKKGRIDELGRAVEFIKKNGVLAGIAGHAIEVPVACEKAGLPVEFYMKTFNSRQYWSAQAATEHDNIWELAPQETAAFMQEVEKPWIAYKVLGAGAIHPREGFQYAYQNGADFICAGMFDFQVAEDVSLARLALEKSAIRVRPWYG